VREPPCHPCTFLFGEMREARRSREEGTPPHLSHLPKEGEVRVW
jgi:hypothetical protein